jgi:predicted CXXCH cytochrome family protein
MTLPPRSRVPLSLCVALVLCLLAARLPPPAGTRGPAAQTIQTPAPLTHPDQVCASCHQAIYDRYQQTTMARGSGLATDALLPGQFHHKPSAVDYRVFLRDNAAWMSFTRPATSPQGELSGQRQLLYYIGSGEKGRTYLYQQDGLWFELPINFYTARNTWDMAPAYDSATSMPAPLPVEPNCLHCHTSGAQPSLPQARNRFATAPFTQAGIGCSACHGDPSAHLAKQGHGPILNPAHLPPDRRDSACIQCHLEGDSLIFRPGRSLAQFVPGDLLSDDAVHFIRASRRDGGARATSQYEALLRSACKRASGDRLTCTTCHDPHSSPAPAERVAFFRARCLSCHTTPAIAQHHHPEQPDCATCHMPSRGTADISHEQVTDHDIQARPHTHPVHTPPTFDTDTLVPIAKATATERELGLAYAQFAEAGDQAAALKAFQLLSDTAATTSRKSPDVQVDVQLALLHQLAARYEPDAAQRAEHASQARAFYAKALQADPFQPAALADLAVLDASTKHLPDAIHLLERLIEADPSQTSAGLNLAFIECSLGHPTEALQLTHHLQSFNPDDPRLRLFATTGTYANQHCPLHPKP